jgi:hypothetical protein
MTQGSMEIGRWALASAEADVQLEVAEPPSIGTDTALAEAVQDTSWTLARFQERFRTQWVAGRVIVSADALEFRPRDLLNTMPLALRVGQLIAIEPVSTLFNKGMRVRLTTGEVLTFRCRSAAGVIESLQSVAGAARAAAA